MDDKKQRIMVVDDDKVLLKNAAVLLGVNYSVSLYSGGREALAPYLEAAHFRAEGYGNENGVDILIYDINKEDNEEE